jgi:hypothetical protein
VDAFHRRKSEARLLLLWPALPAPRSGSEVVQAVVQGEWEGCGGPGSEASVVVFRAAKRNGS